MDNRDNHPLTDDLSLPDLSRRQPRLAMLGREDTLRLHRASCQILRRTGVHVHSERALALLRQAGAAVDGDLARIPPSLVEQALATAPSSFNLYRRGSDEIAIRLDGRAVYFGPGSDTLRYLDPHTGERRPYTLADIADCARLCDGLPHLHFMMSVGVPRDVPEDLYYRDRYGYQPQDFPVAYREYRREISLPIYSRMTDRDAQDVIDAVLTLAETHAI